MAANKHRGEVEVTLDGKAMVMHPTFQAMAEIESRTNAAVLDLVQRAVNLKLKHSELAHIITAGLRAGSEPGAKFEAVGEMIMGEGYQPAVSAASQFLTFAVAGGQEEPAGEAQAAETET